MLSHNFQMPQKYVACRDNPLNQALLVLSRTILFWDISWKDNIFLKRKPESWFGLEHISTPWLCNIEWQLCHYAKSLQAVRGRKNYIRPFISNIHGGIGVIYMYVVRFIVNRCFESLYQASILLQYHISYILGPCHSLSYGRLEHCIQHY